jgi:hypothetical protein
MDFEQLVNNITPDIYRNLKRAVELGKWPDGRLLSQQQKELCMEAVINYEHHHVAEIERVGFIDRGSKSEGEVCEDKSDSDDHATPLKWS